MKFYYNFSLLFIVFISTQTMIASHATTTNNYATLENIILDDEVCDDDAAFVVNRNINVNSINQLKNAISNAKAGDNIIMANGSYTTSGEIVISNKKGRSGNPIIIRAKSIGGVTIKGKAGFRIDNKSEYITIQGFVFKHKGVRGSGHTGKHCLITRNVFECTDPGNTNNSSASYLKISGPNNEISYNTFRNKNFRGPILTIQGPNRKVAQNNWIHHNYFDNFPDKGTNDNAAIQPGYRALIESKAKLLIEYNLFNRLKADAEGTMSVKCWNVTFRYNTVTDCNETVLRQGNESEIYSNFFIGGSGVRLSDSDHKVYNNTFIRTSSGVKIFRRRQADKPGGYSHFPPNNSFVGYNTMVGCKRGIVHDGTGASKNVKMVNNIFYNCETALSKQKDNWTNPTIKGNITWNSSKGALPNSGYKNQNPLFNFDSKGVPSLKSNSPLRGKGTGNYSFVRADVEGQSRGSDKDIGADEFSTAKKINRVLTIKDVGPNANTKTDNKKNKLPEVSFLNPTGDLTLTVGYKLKIEAKASDSDGSVRQVELFINGKSIRKEASAPYIWGTDKNINELNNLPIGKYTIRLVATDNDGGKAEKKITLTVKAKNTENNAPKVSFKKPNSKSIILPKNYTLEIEANATDSDGSIKDVKLYIDGKLIRQESIPPYNWGHKNSPNPLELNKMNIGKHSITLVATDNKGLKTTSQPLIVTISGGTEPKPDSSNCTFNTPRSQSIPSLDKVKYSNVFILGKNGPTLTNLRYFTINWSSTYKNLYQFSINTNDGVPDYFVDLLPKITYKFDSAKPSLTIKNSGIQKLDGSYWVTIHNNNFVMVSKTGGFTMYFSNSNAKPKCNTKNSLTPDISEELVLYQESDNSISIIGASNTSHKIVIYNINGKEVFADAIQNDLPVLRVNTDSLASGLYLVKILSKEGSRQLKFIKN